MFYYITHTAWILVLVLAVYLDLEVENDLKEVCESIYFCMVNKAKVTPSILTPSSLYGARLNMGF